MPHHRLMRVIIDFETDHAGRPMGRLRTAESVEEPFNDWLDLLRAVEGCVARSHHDSEQNVSDIRIATTPTAAQEKSSS